MKTGTGYLNTSSCIKIILWLSKIEVQAEIIEPINKRIAKFYSAHINGSSTAKIMGRKQQFFMKLASNTKLD